MKYYLIIFYAICLIAAALNISKNGIQWYHWISIPVVTIALVYYIIPKRNNYDHNTRT